MNSFNHYTFGGCGEWLMGFLVGLRNEIIGFKTVRVESVILPNLDRAAGSFESPYGTIANRWERKDGQIEMRLTIPPNSNARVTLPATAKSLSLAGKPIANAAGGIAVGSGTFLFQWQEAQVATVESAP